MCCEHVAFMKLRVYAMQGSSEMRSRSASGRLGRPASSLSPLRTCSRSARPSVCAFEDRGAAGAAQPLFLALEIVASRFLLKPRGASWTERRAVWRCGERALTCFARRQQQAKRSSRSGFLPRLHPSRRCARSLPARQTHLARFSPAREEQGPRSRRGKGGKPVCLPSLHRCSPSWPLCPLFPQVLPTRVGKHWPLSLRFSLLTVPVFGKRSSSVRDAFCLSPTDGHEQRQQQQCVFIPVATTL